MGASPSFLFEKIGDNYSVIRDAGRIRDALAEKKMASLNLDARVNEIAGHV